MLPSTLQVTAGARAAHISGNAAERKPAFGSGTAASNSWKRGCRSISQRFLTSFSNGSTDFGIFPSSELPRSNRTLLQHLGFSGVLQPRRHLQDPPTPMLVAHWMPALPLHVLRKRACSSSWTGA